MTSQKNSNPEPTESHEPHLSASGTSPTNNSKDSVATERVQPASEDGPNNSLPVTTSKSGALSRTITAIIPADDWCSIRGLPLNGNLETWSEPLVGWALVSESDGTQRIVGLSPTGLADEQYYLLGYENDPDSTTLKRFKREFYL